MADTISDISGWKLTEDNLSDGGFSNTAPYTAPEFSSPADVSSPSPSGIGFGNIMGAGAFIMSGIGAYMKGEETQKADDYNAQLELMKGEFDVEEIGSAEEDTLSTQQAMYAKAGVELSGSPLDVALSTATNYEYAKQVETFNAQSAANMDIYEGEVAKSRGEMGMAVGILGGIAKLL